MEAKIKIRVRINITSILKAKWDQLTLKDMWVQCNQALVKEERVLLQDSIVVHIWVATETAILLTINQD